LRGARPTAKGRKGQTALECARRRPEVLSLLSAYAGGKPRIIPNPFLAPRSVNSTVELPAPTGDLGLNYPCPPDSSTTGRLVTSKSSSSAQGPTLYPETSQSVSKYRYPDSTPLSTILQTLQNYSVGSPSASSSSFTPSPGARPAPLLTQLQDALSNAMKAHQGLDAVLSSEDPTPGVECSLQPGRIFGKLKCSGASSLSKTISGNDKLLYMYCSNNCSFQFHAGCWKVE